MTLRVSGLQVVKALQGMNDTGIRGPSHLVRRQMLGSTRGNLSLSLHRVEGFGRGMAEALQLGVDVIATAYGGNTDFCADGHVWGGPDLDHAAELMHQVAARRLAMANDHDAAAVDPSRDPSVLAAYRQRFSWAAAGARYRARLEDLWGQRRELAGRLKWRADTAG